MTNEERRVQLARARTNAVAWAEQAERGYSMNAAVTDQVIAMACMWAQVANSLKEGPDADRV